MSDIRIAGYNDLSAIKGIWSTCFGDGAQEIESFFAHFSVTSMISTCSGIPTAAAHLLEIGELVIPGYPPSPCAYIYAVGTLPEFRGLGFGAEITKVITEYAIFQKGYHYCSLVPSNKGLFDFYAKKANYSNVFSISEYTFSYNGNTSSRPWYPVCATEYGEIRESYLKNITHIRFNTDALSYQHKLCIRSGGTLLRTDEGYIAAVELTEDTAFVKELLCPPSEIERNAQCIMAYFGLLRARVRVPGESESFAMLNVNHCTPSYFGFAFD